MAPNAYLHGGQERTPLMDELGEGAIRSAFIDFAQPSKH